MPIASKFASRWDHTFAWNVFLECGPRMVEPEIQLFERRDTIPPPRNVGCEGIGEAKVGARFSHTFVLLAVAASRPDVVITVSIGYAPSFFSGPWLTDTSKSLLAGQLIVPIRQSLRASVRAMPCAPEGLVNVWLRGYFQEDIPLR